VGRSWPHPASVFHAHPPRETCPAAAARHPAVLKRWGSPSSCPSALHRASRKRWSRGFFAGVWGFLGQCQGAPGVLPEWDAQPRLWGHGGGGESVVLGLKFELAVVAGQRLVRLTLRLPRGGKQKVVRKPDIGQGVTLPFVVMQWWDWDGL